MARDEQLEQRVTALAAPLLDAQGVDLVEVEVKGQKGSRVVRVFADTDDGLDLDHIAAISAAVGEELEAQDLVAGKYVLEVSSPGVDRPLRSTVQLRRNTGRDLRVIRTRAAIDRGEKGEVVGELVEVTDTGLLLRTGGKRPEELTVPLADVDHARVVLPF